MEQIEKLITIIRLVHAGMQPGARISVTYHGRQGHTGYVVTHTIVHSAVAEADRLDEEAIIPAVGPISAGGRDLTNERNIALVALDVLESIKTPVDQRAEGARLYRKKKDDPRFAPHPPDAKPAHTFKPGDKAMRDGVVWTRTGHDLEDGRTRWTKDNGGVMDFPGETMMSPQR